MRSRSKTKEDPSCFGTRSLTKERLSAFAFSEVELVVGPFAFLNLVALARKEVGTMFVDKLTELGYVAVYPDTYEAREIGGGGTIRVWHSAEESQVVVEFISDDWDKEVTVAEFSHAHRAILAMLEKWTER